MGIEITSSGSTLRVVYNPLWERFRAASLLIVGVILTVVLEKTVAHEGNKNVIVAIVAFFVFLVSAMLYAYIYAAVEEILIENDEVLMIHKTVTGSRTRALPVSQLKTVSIEVSPHSILRYRIFAVAYGMHSEVKIPLMEDFTPKLNDKREAVLKIRNLLHLAPAPLPGEIDGKDLVFAELYAARDDFDLDEI
eukprot:TRINITY_DN11499_c0_g1::TRINITY_DN11499_c0_g1_i1::g.10932::m.10932 TRINITY_DN11499_c0_g1::TRINITY_DN11499_c0_g1_i1::g.10932  ORF type:complete len:193 (+),score=16.52,PTPLA/PF04387.9/82,PTPLA/PF04387.9/0.22 TRINITY_DN11499_c0_g1_i1:107-685(+)